MYELRRFLVELKRAIAELWRYNLVLHVGAISPIFIRLGLELRQCSNLLYYQRLRAPVGCRQYFEKTRGKIKSFNFDGQTEINTGLAYSICIRQVLTPYLTGHGRI